jgi:ATP-grasp domain, R2K clade family 3
MNDIGFIFPSDYFKPKQVDSAYLEEFECLRSGGFETLVISLEALNSGTPQIFPAPSSSKLVYRGWMLASGDYPRLVAAVRSAGSDLWISDDEYRSNHYLPNWYPLISDLTPVTHFFAVDDDLESALVKLGWSKFFVKDYVKSLKTSIGSIINDPSEISTVVAEMQKFRGTIEGGICIRQVEDFVPETERRYFIINHRVFAASPDTDIPEIVTECANRIKSKFFSVDAIERRDGCQRIVEIGDGQVSGLVDWSVDRFTSLWVESSP